MKKFTLIIAMLMFTVNIFAQNNQRKDRHEENNRGMEKCHPIGVREIYNPGFSISYDNGHHHHRNRYEEHSNCNNNYYEEQECIRPMSAREFECAKQSVENVYFDDTRLTMAKQLVRSNRLLCCQVRELMEIMSFESTRLVLAKYAWNHVYDRENYYQLNDAFVFESSIDELVRFTEYN